MRGRVRAGASEPDELNDHPLSHGIALILVLAVVGLVGGLLAGVALVEALRLVGLPGVRGSWPW
jgi:hypothetical protein